MKRIKSDVVVIGAGIVGLAHAWAASRNGRSVTMIDRSSYAQGASIRNFGMVWPIGQVPGSTLSAAMRSRELWIEAAQRAGFWHQTCGSVYLAMREDELAVMREFVDDHAVTGGYRCKNLTQEQAWAICPAANRSNVIGGFFSETEVGVDPREAIRLIPKMLAEYHNVQVLFDTHAAECRSGVVVLADGSYIEAGEKIVVCSGSDTQTLFPGLLDRKGALLCKLQMLATPPQPNNWQVGPMIASGSTLRHYDAFKVCQSLSALKQRFAEETPELDQLGIHLMAAQNGLGEVVMGDSHEYGDEINPFESSRIEALMLKELHKLLDLKNFSIARRWHGIYLKVAGKTHLAFDPVPGVTVFNGLGGAGMTLSFGLADQMWSSDESVAVPIIPADETAIPETEEASR